MEWREEGRLWEEEILLSRKDNANEEVAMKNRERESHNPNNNNSWTDVILSQLSFVVTRAKMTMKACQLVGAREANKKKSDFFHLRVRLDLGIRKGTTERINII